MDIKSGKRHPKQRTPVVIGCSNFVLVAIRLPNGLFFNKCTMLRMTDDSDDVDLRCRIPENFGCLHVPSPKRFCLME